MHAPGAMPPPPHPPAVAAQGSSLGSQAAETRSATGSSQTAPRRSVGPARGPRTLGSAERLWRGGLDPARRQAEPCSPAQSR